MNDIIEYLEFGVLQHSRELTFVDIITSIYRTIVPFEKLTFGVNVKWIFPIPLLMGYLSLYSNSRPCAIFGILDLSIKWLMNCLMLTYEYIEGHRYSLILNWSDHLILVFVLNQNFRLVNSWFHVQSFMTVVKCLSHGMLALLLKLKLTTFSLGCFKLRV